MPPRECRIVPTVVLLVSACVLTLQVTLTRILSFVGYYHHVFLVVSSVMLGLGLGGFLRHRYPSRPRSGGTIRTIRFPAPGALAGFAVSIPACVAGCLLMPGGAGAAGYILVLTPPFICAGMFLAAAYAHGGSTPRAVYAADLAGAALGCAGVAASIRLMGAPNTALLLGALTGMVAAAVTRRPLTPAVAVVVSLGLCLVNASLGADITLLVRRNHPKTMFQALREPTRRIADTAWSVYARTDLVEDADVPGLKRIYTDAANSTAMVAWDGKTVSSDTLRGFIGLFPFRFPRAERVACIGAGGGLDVVAALAGGAQHVDAVEINPDIVAMVRRESAFNGGMYAGHPAVAVHVEEGRVFMRRPGPAYDLIILSLVLTPAPQGVSYALVENYVYTVEAFDDYLRRLAPGGRLVIIEQSLERSVRQFATGLAALQRRGAAVREAPRHMALFTVPEATGDSPDAYRNIFLLRNEPFSADEGYLMLAEALRFGLAPVYVPYAVERGPYEALVSGVLSLETFIANAPFNIRPCTDDSPFFFNFGTNVLQRMEGLLPLAGLIALSLLAGTLAPLLRPIGGERPVDLLPWTVCFGLLGVGYMMVEVTLVQQCMLFLGTPSWAFTVVLFAMLLGSGLGGMFGPALITDHRHRAVTSALAVAVALVCLRFLPGLFGRLLQANAAGRVGVTVAVVLPIGFVMGMPFPAALALLRGIRPDAVAWVWGVNGIASVAGSLAAVMGAMEYGYTAVQCAAAFLYLLVCGIVARSVRSTVTSG
jgi:protein-L-isoaspartate O-methyltransferase